MAAGRPREWDREWLIEELLDWAERPDSLNLNAFCCQKHIMMSATKLLTIKEETEKFREAYDIAKGFLATRREEANSEKILSDQAYKCNLRVYDKFNSEKWKNEEKFKAGLAKEVAKAEDEKIVSKYDAYNAQLESLRSQRKIDDNKIKSETKS